MLKRVLFFVVVFLHSAFIFSMYRARCTPFASLQRKEMKESFYHMIDSATISLCASIFTFLDKEAARKLALAQARGVKVQVIMDGSSDRGAYGIRKFLEKFNVPISVYSASNSINHNKYLIVDGKKSWISSMNFTNPAYDRNRESAVLIYSRSIAKFYKKDFQETYKLIQEQAKKEQLKKIKFEKDLALERKKHEERMRLWKKAQRNKELCE